jgi:hypothetical protein
MPGVFDLRLKIDRLRLVGVMEGGPGVCPLSYSRPTCCLERARVGDSSGSDSSHDASMNSVGLALPLLRGVGLLLIPDLEDDSRLVILLRSRFGELERPSSSASSSWSSSKRRGRAYPCPRSRSFRPCGRSSSILNDTLRPLDLLRPLTNDWDRVISTSSGEVCTELEVARSGDEGGSVAFERDGVNAYGYGCG